MTKKVIIIDDSATSLNLLKAAFLKDGWEVYDIKDAKFALDAIFNIAPDLIVTDAIMPSFGGFRLVNLIRNNELISKIPIIIYSIMEEKNAKFYIKEQRSEYFLKKDDNIDELLALCNKTIEKFPLDEDYKYKILNFTNIKTNLNTNTKTLEEHFREIRDFNCNDEKLTKDIYSVLYSEINYNLCVIMIYFDETLYFDIKNILLSPVFQNNLIKKFNAKNHVLFKKYAPNLKVYSSEEEFQNKIQLDFEYKNEKTASIIFYSNEKLNNIDKIKPFLEDIFKARKINRTPKKEKYISQKIVNTNNLNKETTFFAAMEISNFSELSLELNTEELDMINTKIVQKILDCLEKNEQIYKNDEDEYSLIIFARDKIQAQQRLDFIINLIDKIEYSSYKVEAKIGASKCIIQNEADFYEAQKEAGLMLEYTTKDKRVVIKDEQ